MSFILLQDLTNLSLCSWHYVVSEESNFKFAWKIRITRRIEINLLIKVNLNDYRFLKGSKFFEFSTACQRSWVNVFDRK